MSEHELFVADARNKIAAEDAPRRGYISSLAPRPYALTPAGRAPSRVAELWAALRWALASLIHPADTEAARAQPDA
jgi:hypothetical protein